MSLGGSVGLRKVGTRTRMRIKDSRNPRRSPSDCGGAPQHLESPPMYAMCVLMWKVSRDRRRSRRRMQRTSRRCK